MASQLGLLYRPGAAAGRGWMEGAAESRAKAAQVERERDKQALDTYVKLIQSGFEPVDEKKGSPTGEIVFIKGIGALSPPKVTTSEIWAAKLEKEQLGVEKERERTERERVKLATTESVGRVKTAIAETNALSAKQKLEMQKEINQIQLDIWHNKLSYEEGQQRIQEVRERVAQIDLDKTKSELRIQESKEEIQKMKAALEKILAPIDLKKSEISKLMKDVDLAMKKQDLEIGELDILKSELALELQRQRTLTEKARTERFGWGNTLSWRRYLTTLQERVRQNPTADGIIGDVDELNRELNDVNYFFALDKRFLQKDKAIEVPLPTVNGVQKTLGDVKNVMRTYGVSLEEALNDLATAADSPEFGKRLQGLRIRDIDLEERKFPK